MADSSVKTDFSQIETIDASSWLTTRNQGNSAEASAVACGAFVTLSFMTNSVSHTEGEIIMEVPVGYRPNAKIEFMAYRNGTPIQLRFYSGSTGIMIWLPTGTLPGTARIYGCLTYIRKLT